MCIMWGMTQQTEQAIRSFPARLRRQRERAGLTIRELSGAAGVGASTICELEAGRFEPRQETLRRLVRALGCRPQELAPASDLMVGAS